MTPDAVGAPAVDAGAELQAAHFEQGEHGCNTLLREKGAEDVVLSAANGAAATTAGQHEMSSDASESNTAAATATAQEGREGPEGPEGQPSSLRPAPPTTGPTSRSLDKNGSRIAMQQHRRTVQGVEMIVNKRKAHLKPVQLDTRQVYAIDNTANVDWVRMKKTLRQERGQGSRR
jgi:hypothetical protein